jgi:hypothetical protein
MIVAWSNALGKHKLKLYLLENVKNFVPPKLEPQQQFQVSIIAKKSAWMT